MPLESPVGYAICDCTVCTSGRHVLASVLRGSMASSVTSFSTHGAAQEFMTAP